MIAMQESAIRDAVDVRVRATLERHPGTGSVAVRHELGVCAGRRRVDVAAINGHLDGWEIKSDADTLRRLPDQVAAFSRVWEIPYKTGALVHVSEFVKRKVKNYHGVSTYAATRAVYYARSRYFPHKYDDDHTYEYTMWEYECSGSACERTTNWTNIRWIVEWNDGVKMHGLLRTMYCHRVRYQKCPSWVKTSAMWLGAPGPQILG